MGYKMGLDLTGLGAVSDLVNNAINKIWPDKSEQEKAEIANAFALMQGQLEINKEEAKSANVFIAGWRPFIGWVCGVAFAYHFVVQPFLTFVMAQFGHNITLPAFDMSALNTVLMGLLGLGGLRTFEKIKGGK
jgi:hypothetical protein